MVALKRRLSNLVLLVREIAAPKRIVREIVAPKRLVRKTVRDRRWPDRAHKELTGEANGCDQWVTPDNVHITRIFSPSIRVARMVRMSYENMGFLYTRIDIVPTPELLHPRFLVVASHEPLTHVPPTWRDPELLND